MAMSAERFLELAEEGLGSAMAPAEAEPRTVPAPVSSNGHSSGQPLDSSRVLAEPEATQAAAPGEAPPITDIANAVAPEAKGYGHTSQDRMMATKFIEMFGDSARYVPAQNAWITWNGVHWQQDRMLAAQGMADQVCEAIWVEARKNHDLRQFAERAQTAQGQRAMLEVARSRLALDPKVLDTDPMLLNTPSGTIELETGKLREHNREDWITKVTGASHVETAKCPKWEQFLSEVLVKKDLSLDPDLVAGVQRFFGYGLTGLTTEHVFAILIGDGFNGKGVLIHVLDAVLGDYSLILDAGSLVTQRHEAHPTWKMDLFRVRMAFSQETDGGRKLNEALVKTLTGGDKLSGRRLFENNWTFEPTHKLVLATNDLPVITGKNVGIWERQKPIPFNRIFEDAEQTKDLKEQLVGESAGILNWLLQGLADQQSIGLCWPEAVMTAARQYREESDELLRCIRDCFNVGDVFKDALTPVTPLYQRYCSWTHEEGIEEDRRLTQKAFSRDLERLGYHEQRKWNPDTNRTDRYRRGIAIKEASL